LCPIIYLP
jgi:hypothetical protein